MLIPFGDGISRVAAKMRLDNQEEYVMKKIFTAIVLGVVLAGVSLAHTGFGRVILKTRLIEVATGKVKHAGETTQRSMSAMRDKRRRRNANEGNQARHREADRNACGIEAMIATKNC
jgi:hypothetical protein